MDKPPELKNLDPDDVARLIALIKTLRRVDGWCRINRAIGKFILVTVIGLLILFSQALDAIKNLIGWKH